jgi:hypothetical protein
MSCFAGSSTRSLWIETGSELYQVNETVFLECLPLGYLYLPESFQSFWDRQIASNNDGWIAD